MKTLTLLRHAKSGWDDQATRDFDRTLQAKGKRAAAVMGRHLKASGAAFDHIVASPAMRVRETLAEVGRGYGGLLDPEWEKRVYLASAATLIEVLHGVPAAAEHVLLMGHNPGLEDLVLLLVPESGEAGPRSDVEEKFPTASLAVLDVPVDWADLAPGTATLTSFTRPRDLDPSLGPDED